MGEAGGRGPGYRYFGAAKQLPGVRELFEKEAPRQVGRAGVQALVEATEGAAGPGLSGALRHVPGCQVPAHTGPLPRSLACTMLKQP